mmetsp:Transcript_28576/g.67012  ORF Transcript_28576/g.67012 Transcript_28576/m.67012 type:complete len:225 (+) Transcript_28576:171-845(+)
MSPVSPTEPSFPILPWKAVIDCLSFLFVPPDLARRCKLRNFAFESSTQWSTSLLYVSQSFRHALSSLAANSAAESGGGFAFTSSSSSSSSSSFPSEFISAHRNSLTCASLVLKRCVCDWHICRNISEISPSDSLLPVLRRSGLRLALYARKRSSSRRNTSSCRTSAKARLERGVIGPFCWAVVRPNRSPRSPRSSMLLVPEGNIPLLGRRTSSGRRAQPPPTEN